MKAIEDLGVLVEPITSQPKEPITLQAILKRGANPENHLAVTTYGLAGQGDTSSQAKESVIFLIIHHLTYYAEKGSLLRPEKQLRNAEEVRDYFKADRILGIPLDVIVAKDETKTIPADSPLPELIFEFYRLELKQ